MSTKILPRLLPAPTRAQTAIVNEKGQVVIPAEVRRRVGLKPGTRVVFWAEENRILFESVEKFVEELPGMFGAGPSLEDMRDKDHRDDKER